MAERPCFKALREDWAFPSWVLGPVDFWELRRLAVRRAWETMGSSFERWWAVPTLRESDGVEKGVEARCGKPSCARSGVPESPVNGSGCPCNIVRSIIKPVERAGKGDVWCLLTLARL